MEEPKDWEKEFDKKYKKTLTAGMLIEEKEVITLEMAKQFISQLLSSEKLKQDKEWKDILKKQKEHSELREKLVIEEVKKEQKDYWMNYAQDYADKAYKQGKEELRKETMDAVEVWLLRLHNEPDKWTVEQALNHLNNS